MTHDPEALAVILMMSRLCAQPSPFPRGRVVAQDSDLWAIYTRACLGQVLEHSAAAALADDPDLEALETGFTQAARPAPANRGRR